MPEQQESTKKTFFNQCPGHTVFYRTIGRLRRYCTKEQTYQIVRCSHTQNMDMDDYSVQNLDLIQLNMSAWEFSNRGFMGKSRGGQWVRTLPPPPPENYKNIRFHSNAGPDPLRTTKLQSHNRHAIQMAFRLRANNDPFIMVFGYSLP